MHLPTPYPVDEITGRVRPRNTWLGKVIMQVEVQRKYFKFPHQEKPDSVSTYWRDAKKEDFLKFIVVFTIADKQEKL